MDKILADGTPLSNTLLASDEAQYDRQCQNHVLKLSKQSLQDFASKDILDDLDPSIHTIPYLHLLLANVDSITATGKAAPRQLPASVLPEGSLWPYITQILLDFNPIQVRYVGELFSRVVNIVVQGAEQTGNMIPAIQLLSNVILRLDNTSSTLTTTHYALIRLCLLSRAYSEAVAILDQPIYHVPGVIDKATESRSYTHLCSPDNLSSTYLTPNTGLTQKITTRCYLEYHLLGAMCYMAVRQYEKALFFLETVLICPTQQNAASAIMIEAYKKWILVSLMIDGKPLSSPKTASQLTMRHLRSITRAYEAVSTAFKEQRFKKLRAEIEEGIEIWQEDCNYGLIVEVYNAYRKFSILRLGSTFAAISIDEVAKKTSPDPQDLNETIAYLQSLIIAGDLKATITNSKSGGSHILRFLPTTSAQKSESEVELELATQTFELQRILKHISDLDHSMEISKEYIDWLKKLKKIKDEDKKTGNTRHSGAPGIMEDMDEDMMGNF